MASALDSIIAIGAVIEQLLSQCSPQNKVQAQEALLAANMNASGAASSGFEQVLEKAYAAVFAADAASDELGRRLYALCAAVGDVHTVVLQLLSLNGPEDSGRQNAMHALDRLNRQLAALAAPLKE